MPRPKQSIVLNGTKVRELRSTMGTGVTQEFFVSLQDVSFSLSTLQRMERSQPISQELGEELADVLGVSLDDIIQKTGSLDSSGEAQSAVSSPAAISKSNGDPPKKTDLSTMQMIKRLDRYIARSESMLSAENSGRPLPEELEFHKDELISLDEECSKIVTKALGYVPDEREWMPPMAFAFRHGYGEGGEFGWLKKLLIGLKRTMSFLMDISEPEQP